MGLSEFHHGLRRIIRGMDAFTLSSLPAPSDAATRWRSRRAHVARRLWALGMLCAGAHLTPIAMGHESEASAPTNLDAVIVVAHGVSDMPAASVGDLSAVDLANLPLLRPAAILEAVPGLIVTQHSGEGKANQYFLRAFNLDHGTDLATDVDGMPVNLPSHAHGQGYSDLNFLIPETVGDLHYRKGPYYADTGDFSAAGSVRLALADHFKNQVEVGGGEFGFRRFLLLDSHDVGAGSLNTAVESYHHNGPFDVPDDYQRLNALLRYVVGDSASRTTLTAMHYDGHWNSTDQVAQSLIDTGVIDRFGSVAPTDGGRTHRQSLSVTHHHETSASTWDLSGYLIGYGLDLYSTFTDHLVDAEHGDQMRQHDDRLIYGLRLSRRVSHTLAGLPSSTLVGIDTRTDDIRDVGIDSTASRQVLAVQQDARVLERAAAAYVENATQWAPKVTMTVALRADTVDFDVTDRLVGADGVCDSSSDPLGCNTGHRRAGLLSPKFGLAVGPYAGVRGFLNIADGFHSNDARGVTRDPSGLAGPPVTPLTRAHSAEVGVVIDHGAWHLALDAYQLKLASELVFSGDAGVTEPSGATTRRGVEWSQRYTLNEHWQWDLNGAYSRGLFDRAAPVDDLGCGDAAPQYPCAQTPAIVGREIPNAPALIIDGGLTYTGASIDASLRVRHFGRSPVVEDGSVHSAAYGTLDARIGWHRGAWKVNVDLFNLANHAWNDITYYYAYRHPGEANASVGPVVHPGMPRTARLTVARSY